MVNGEEKKIALIDNETRRKSETKGMASFQTIVLTLLFFKLEK
jgi:hypothetical protein